MADDASQSSESSSSSSSSSSTLYPPSSPASASSSTRGKLASPPRSNSSSLRQHVQKEFALKIFAKGSFEDYNFASEANKDPEFFGGSRSVKRKKFRNKLDQWARFSPQARQKLFEELGVSKSVIAKVSSQASSKAKRKPIGTATNSNISSRSDTKPTMSSNKKEYKGIVYGK